MVNESSSPAVTPALTERALVLSYAPAASRAALAALLAVDETLAGLVRGAREPLIAQMRLTWWHGALCALDDGAPPPAHPVLEAVARDALPRGVTGARLAATIDGWEALLDQEPLDDQRLGTYAAARGRGLFEAAGVALSAGPGDPLAAAGEGWALTDLAAHVGDLAEHAAAVRLARERLRLATALHWSRAARALGAMAHAAQMDLAEPPIPAGSPRRVARLLRHRLTGG